MKPKFYRLKKILSKNAQYNVIFGERSNGKTYAVLEYALEQYVKFGHQLAIVRRWREDFTGKAGNTMFDNHVGNGLISDLTEGRWTNVYYFGSRWYLCCYDPDGKRITDSVPFAYGFALTQMEHDKSTAYPGIKTICFDEFLARSVYVPDEFVLFANVLSTIIRHRTDVKIFMLGNTVNKFCPYFHEMGLRHVKKMQPGDIDVYTYGNSELKVAVEYTLPTAKGKESDVYFAFDNPKLKMITSGSWEIDIYPHCPYKYKPKDVAFQFFVKFDEQILHCEVVTLDTMQFIMVHPKTSDIKNSDKDFVYSLEYDPRPNWQRNIMKPCNRIGKKIFDLFRADKVFYSDNETGEVMRNYLNSCSKG